MRDVQLTLQPSGQLIEDWSGLVISGSLTFLEARCLLISLGETAGYVFRLATPKPGIDEFKKAVEVSTSTRPRSVSSAHHMWMWR